MEHWAPVFGYEGIYETSTKGNVRSVRRLMKMRVGGGKSFEEVRGGCVLKPFPKAHGYMFVTLRHAASEHAHKKLQIRSVHSIVCEAFHGTRPSTKHQVNHKDGNKTNNAPDNLEWMTPIENIQHSAFVIGTHVKGSRCPASKLKESDIPAICTAFNSGTYIKDIARQYGVSTFVINSILSGKSWRHVARPIKPQGTRPLRSKFSDEEIHIIKKMRLEGSSYKEIRAIVKISHGYLSQILNALRSG